MVFFLNAEGKVYARYGGRDADSADKRPSLASSAGLQPGDVVRRLNGVPVHSFADAQFALDRAPATGAIAVAWQRGEEIRKEKLALPAGWRKTDISWRPSLRRLVPSARL